MPYFNYHAVAKGMILEGRLKYYYYADRYKNISPALILVFDDARRPVMPIRRERWDEYADLLKNAVCLPKGVKETEI